MSGAGPNATRNPSPDAGGSRFGVWKVIGGVLGGLAALAGIIAVLPLFGVQLPQLSGSASSASPDDETESAPPTPPSVLDQAASLHAGYTVAKVEEVFGAPLTSRALESEGWMQNDYLRDNAAATAVIDPQGGVAYYSLLVCDADARPSVATPAGTTVTLGVEIDSAETTADGEASTDDRELGYVDGETGGSLAQLVEAASTGPASGNGNRTYLLGINHACSSTDFGVRDSAGVLSYFGPASSAPQPIAEYRAATPADFYAEVHGDFEVTDEGLLTLSGDGHEVEGVFPSVVYTSLPAGFGVNAG